MTISLVAAMTTNRVIGKQGKIPWHIPGEQKIFRRLTLGKVLLFGRKTYEAIGRSLPGRLTIVITRQAEFKAHGAYVAHTMEETLAMAQEYDREIMVGGGGEIYGQLLPLADRVYLTTVYAEFDGDVFFPDLPPDQFVETATEKFAASTPYTFSVFERVKPKPLAYLTIRGDGCRSPGG
jgi:dihydrofolate reductase